MENQTRKRDVLGMKGWSLTLNTIELPLSD